MVGLHFQSVTFLEAVSWHSLMSLLLLKGVEAF